MYYQWTLFSAYQSIESIALNMIIEKPNLRVSDYIRLELKKLVMQYGGLDVSLRMSKIAR